MRHLLQTVSSILTFTFHKVYIDTYRRL